MTTSTAAKRNVEPHRSQLCDATKLYTAHLLQIALSNPSACSSTTGHANLQRFAQDYIFGATANLGTKAGPQPQNVSPLSQCKSPDTPLCMGDGLCSAHENVFQTHRANLVGFKYDGQLNKHHCTGRAVWESSKDNFPSSKHFDNVRAREHDTKSAQDDSQRQLASEVSANHCRDRIESVLVFGERTARRKTIPFRERIEKRGISKRHRLLPDVDTLAEMIDRSLKTVTGDSNEEVCAGNSHSFVRMGSKNNKNTANCPRIPPVQLNDCDRHDVSSNVPINNPHDREKSPTSNESHRYDSKPVRFEDDDGTADELSFLVQQCDLRSEQKQPHFMPYIS